MRRGRPRGLRNGCLLRGLNVSGIAMDWVRGGVHDPPPIRGDQRVRLIAFRKANAGGHDRSRSRSPPPRSREDGSGEMNRAARRAHARSAAQERAEREQREAAAHEEREERERVRDELRRDTLSQSHALRERIYDCPFFFLHTRPGPAHCALCCGCSVVSFVACACRWRPQWCRCRCTSHA
jgi:hypothetical protein